jgi:hypothetical protein
VLIRPNYALFTPSAAAAFSQSLSLDGSSYASISDAAQTGLEPSPKFTFGGWHKASFTTAHWVINKYSVPDSAQRSYYVFLEAIGGAMELKALIASDAGTSFDLYKWTLSVLPGDDVWFNIHVSADATQPSSTTFIAYEDGVSLGNGTAVIANNISAIGTGVSPYLVGVRDNSIRDFHYSGLMSDHRFYDDVISGATIASNYNQKISPSTANLVSNWLFDGSLADETTNANNMTMTGTETYVADVPPVTV